MTPSPSAPSRAPRSDPATRAALVSRWMPVAAFAFITTLVLLSASTRLMWYDELATYAPARLATVSQTLAFYTQGLDTPSPTPALMLHGTMRILGDSDFRGRLPWAILYLASSALAYLFVRKRYSAPYAALAILFPSATAAFFFATEMRAYGLVWVATALMAVAWQQRHGGSRRFAALSIFWLAFAGAVLSHAFAVFLFVPFALAESAAVATNRRVDKPLWAALLTAPLAILLLLPAMEKANHYYGQRFWSKPHLTAAPSSILGTYIFFLGRYGLPLVLVVAIALPLLRRFLLPSRPAESATPFGFTRPEWVLVLSLAAYPIYAYLGSMALGVFVPQYCFPVIVGLTFLFVGAAARYGRESFRIAAVLCIILVFGAAAGQGRILAHVWHQWPPNTAGELRAEAWAEAACRSGLPVLAAAPHDFWVWRHYGPPCLQKQLLYAEDLARTDRDTYSDELNMRLFSPSLHLPVVNAQAFFSSHRRFLVAATPKRSWLMPYLKSSRGAKRFSIVAQQSYPSIDGEFTQGLGPRTVTIYTIEQTPNPPGR